MTKYGFLEEGEIARVLCDSISPTGSRKLTYLIKLHRSLLAEYNTHRQVVRSVRSSRAVPIERTLQEVSTNPFIPMFTANQSGMQGNLISDENLVSDAVDEWMRTLEDILYHVKKFQEMNIHKQDVNRLMEPFMEVEILTTGTEWENLFELRCDSAAAPSFQKVAKEMKHLYDTHEPTPLNFGDWHFPFSDLMPEGLDLLTKLKIAVARCARISYNTHGGEINVEKDLDLFNQLFSNKHWSPFEHISMCVDNSENKLLRMIDSKLRKYLFWNDKKESFTWTRNYSGFYTFRHQIEDGLWKNITQN